MNYGIDYVPESAEEELFEIVGRLKAFAAYVNSAEYSISREICADMLGFALKKEKAK